MHRLNFNTQHLTINQKIQSISVWFYKKNYYLQAYSTDINGVRDTANNPIHIVKATESYRLGAEVLETIKECVFDVPTGNSCDTNGRKIFLKCLGVKSEKQLMTEGKLVNIYLVNKKLELCPTSFNSKFMISEPDNSLHCSLFPDEITQKLSQAFEQDYQ